MRRSPFRGDTYKQRTCLTCGKVFWSEGPWNRRCPECKRQWQAFPDARNPGAPNRLWLEGARRKGDGET